MSPQDPETPRDPAPDDAVTSSGPAEGPGSPSSGASPTSQEGPAPDDAPTGAPTGGSVDDAPADVELTPELLDAVVAERDDFLDRLQRSHAELENYRKQTQKRLADEGERALAGFVERLLPVLDGIDAARSHGSTDIDAVATQLLGFLEKEGLERVSPTGEEFDPNVADAVMHEPGEGDGGPMVTEVLRTGYLWNGRVIRPAMVKVAG